MVAGGGFEPSTLRVWTECSSQLSYPAIILKFIKLIGGAKRDRTADPLRARQVLSQLSYGPNFYKWSGRQDLNLRPPGPKPGALPSCATSRKNGALGRNRTHNLLIRSQALYPVELLAHFHKWRFLPDSNRWWQSCSLLPYQLGQGTTSLFCFASLITLPHYYML